MITFQTPRAFTARPNYRRAGEHAQIAERTRGPAPPGRRPPLVSEPVHATTLRRVRASDAEAFQRFVGGLSALSRRMRFHGAVSHCSPALLRYLTQPDQLRHQAWVALDLLGGEDALVGEARFVACEGSQAEFAIAIADREQGRGLADRLLQTMVAAATRFGIGVLFGDVLDGNARMIGFLRRHGFEIDPEAEVEAGVSRWRRRLGLPEEGPRRAPAAFAIRPLPSRGWRAGWASSWFR